MNIEEIKKNAPKGATEYRSNGIYYNASGQYYCRVNKCFYDSLSWNNFKVLVKL